MFVRALMESSCHLLIKTLILLICYTMVGTALITHHVMCVLCEMSNSVRGRRISLP